MTSTSGSDCSSVTPAAVLPKLPVTLDTKGRVRTSREQRRVILAEFERSGVSAARFAQRAGLKYSTFAAWVQRYRRTKRPKRRSPLRLLEAVVGPAPLMPALQVQLPGGARLEIREAGQIPLAAALVRALEKPC
jgi:transposase-like protein